MLQRSVTSHTFVMAERTAATMTTSSSFLVRRAAFAGEMFDWRDMIVGEVRGDALTAFMNFPTPPVPVIV